MKQKLLIVDDERGIVDMMRDYFSPQYQVLTAGNGQEAVRQAGQQPDLILLDINMPGMDGLTVCRTIREPFDLDELGARVAAHLRREQRHSRAAVRFFGECAVDYSARTVTVGGQAVALSRREFDILELLSLHAGQVFDRERIYELVWGIDGGGSSDTVMEHVRKIRAKLAAHTSRSCIETVWGCGYKWNG